jgi:ribosomal protein S18 acetylase RimI-like enzyme
MRIRAAEAGDIDPIKACIDAAYGPYVARLGRPPAPMLADYGALVAGGKVQVIGEDRITGLIVYYPRGDHIHVETVAVLPEAHGKGFGRALMGHAEAAAGRLRLAAVELYTHLLMTENIRYYNALGYREIRRGEEDGFPRIYFRKPAAP